MNNLAKLRVVLLPLFGAIGGICAVVWPQGQAAFCAGFGGLI